MIVGINDSRLNQVAYDFNVKFLKVDQTIERLIDQMTIGETALPNWKLFIRFLSIDHAELMTPGTSTMPPDSTLRYSHSHSISMHYSQRRTRQGVARDR